MLAHGSGNPEKSSETLSWDLLRMNSMIALLFKQLTLLPFSDNRHPFAKYSNTFQSFLLNTAKTTFWSEAAGESTPPGFTLLVSKWLIIRQI
jgi:hypothetical protein